MSNILPEGQPEPIPAEAPAPPVVPQDTAALENQVAELTAQLALLTTAKPSKVAPAKAALARVSRSLWSAVASTAAVKQERSLAVLIVTRLLLSAGAADGVVQLAKLVITKG